MSNTDSNTKPSVGNKSCASRRKDSKRKQQLSQFAELSEQIRSMQRAQAETRGQVEAFRHEMRSWFMRRG